MDTPQSLKKKSNSVPTLKLSKPIDTEALLNTKVKSTDNKTKPKQLNEGLVTRLGLTAQI